MSKSVKAKPPKKDKPRKPSASSHHLGDRNPDNPKQVWVMCALCSRGRWVTTTTPLKLKAAGFIKSCMKCAPRRPWRLKTSDELLLSGSILHWMARDFTCGICNSRHSDAGMSRGAQQPGFCKGCKPWVAIALKREHYTNPSSERDAIYTKIKRIRRALEGDAREIPTGPPMPFWGLVQRFAERFPQAAPDSLKSQSHYVRHLALFFVDTPIGNIGYDSARAFEKLFLSQCGRLGPRAPHTTRGALDTLRRMLGFAKEHGWLEDNPLPKGVALAPPCPQYKSDRILTLEEEVRLHEACIGKLSYLRAVLIYVADAPAYLRDFLKLRWIDVDFENGLIAGRRGFVEMTPRLTGAMHSLWEQSDRYVDNKVILRAIDGCNEDFSKVRVAAGIEGLQIGDIRRTGAWRLQQAGRRLEQIAAALGISHLDNVSTMLQFINPAMAQQEINSLQFQQFIRAQFIGSQNDQKNRSTLGAEKKRGGSRNVKWTAISRAELLRCYEELLSKIKKMDETLSDDVKEKLKLRGNKPSDIALDYAAECLNVEPNEYLRRTVLPEARRERDRR